MPAKTQAGPLPAAFPAVVVGDVQDHFDAGVVDRVHHVAKFGRRVILRQARIRHEKLDRVVTPQVAQPPLDQELLVHQVNTGISSSEVMPSAFR